MWEFKIKLCCCAASEFVESERKMVTFLVFFFYRLEIFACLMEISKVVLEFFPFKLNLMSKWKITITKNLLFYFAEF